MTADNLHADGLACVLAAVLRCSHYTALLLSHFISGGRREPGDEVIFDVHEQALASFPGFVLRLMRSRDLCGAGDETKIFSSRSQIDLA